MKQAMRRAMIAVAVLCSVLPAAGQARASTIVNFSYSGRGGPDFAGLISTGTGSFSFADGLETIGLADLTSFSFTLDENTPNTTIFGISDLTSFSATLGAGPTVTSLALGTSKVQSNNEETWPREFFIASLDPDGASSRYFFVIESLELTTGTATITSVLSTVPEPSSVTLGGCAALIGILAWSRHAR